MGIGLVFVSDVLIVISPILVGSQFSLYSSCSVVVMSSFSQVVRFLSRVFEIGGPSSSLSLDDVSKAQKLAFDEIKAQGSTVAKDVAELKSALNAFAVKTEAGVAQVTTLATNAKAYVEEWRSEQERRRVVREEARNEAESESVLDRKRRVSRKSVEECVAREIFRASSIPFEDLIRQEPFVVHAEVVPYLRGIVNVMAQARVNGINGYKRSDLCEAMYVDDNHYVGAALDFLCDLNGVSVIEEDAGLYRFTADGLWLLLRIPKGEELGGGEEE